MLRLFSPRLVRIEEKFSAMENGAINVATLTTPESSRHANERTPARDTDETLIEEDTDSHSDVEEIAKNTCKNCSHKRCILDRRIASVVKECARVSAAADELSNGFEDRVTAVTSSREHVTTIETEAAASAATFAARINIARTSLDRDFEALKAEVQRSGGNHAHVGTQTAAEAAPTFLRKRKMTEEGSPGPEVVGNGGGRMVKGHARKMSKISNALPSRHATTTQCVRE